MRFALPKAPNLVVRNARIQLGLTQEEFASRIQTSQSLVSKYEGGQVAPPAGILMHCVHILSQRADQSVSESALLELVKQRLSGKDRAGLRTAVAELILGLVPVAAAKRSPRRPRPSS
jgi:transcriptional regulator with XRE-family HTH domain